MKEVVINLRELKPVDVSHFWGDEPDFDESKIRMTTLRDVAAILYRSPQGVMWDLAYKIHEMTGFNYDKLVEAFNEIIETEEKMSIEESVSLFLSTTRPIPSNNIFKS